MNMNAAALLRAGADHIRKVRELAKNHQINWVPADLSEVAQDHIKHPERAIRAFTGTVGGIRARTDGYGIYVMQGNTTDQGIVYLGAITALLAPHVVNLPPVIAAELYHAAAASQN